MTLGQLTAALARAAGIFAEGYDPNGPDFRDAIDIHAFGELLHDEIQVIVEREVRDRLQARYEVETEAMVDELADALGEVFDEGPGDG